MKAYWGVKLQLHAFLTSAEVVVSFTTQPLYPRGKSSRYLLDRRLVGPQRWSGRDDAEKESLLLPEVEPRSSDPYSSHHTD